MDDSGKAVVGVIIAVLVINWLRGSCRQQDVNEKLAEVAQEAVRMAKTSNEEAAAARRGSDVWAGLSLLAAVAVPLVIAFLLFRHASGTPDELETIAELQELAEADRPKLSAPDGPNSLARPVEKTDRDPQNRNDA